MKGGENMKPSDEVRSEVLMKLSDTPTTDKGAYNELLKDLRSKYPDQHWLHDVLIKMDYNNDELLNLVLTQDAQSSLSGLIVGGSHNYLTPDGEALVSGLK